MGRVCSCMFSCCLYQFSGEKKRNLVTFLQAAFLFFGNVAFVSPLIEGDTCFPFCKTALPTSE